MTIYPAIDMLGGKCVRLTQGRYDDSTVYGENPADVAKEWEQKGASWLHIVDLDGARAGEPINLEEIKNIIKSVSIPIQLGGGIRTMEHIETLISMGISRVILGTSAVKNRQLVLDATQKFGEKIAVGIDAKDGYVAISGWEQVSEFKAVEFAKIIEACGVKTIIYTDIATDGMLTGPNLEAMSEMASEVSINVIASGGVGKLDDVKNLIPTGVSGAIIGRALYAGKLNLEDAICLQSE